MCPSKKLESLFAVSQTGGNIRFSTYVRINVCGLFKMAMSRHHQGPSESGSQVGNLCFGQWGAHEVW